MKHEYNAILGRNITKNTYSSLDGSLPPLVRSPPPLVRSLPPLVESGAPRGIIRYQSWRPLRRYSATNAAPLAASFRGSDFSGAKQYRGGTASGEGSP